MEEKKKQTKKHKIITLPGFWYAVESAVIGEIDDKEWAIDTKTGYVKQSKNRTETFSIKRKSRIKPFKDAVNAMVEDYFGWEATKMQSINIERKAIEAKLNGNREAYFPFAKFKVFDGKGIFLVGLERDRKEGFRPTFMIGTGTYDKKVHAWHIVVR